ncbi:MAG: DUF2934 domain-containing protein [Candidatus Omnitrophica bacterium]|nr:DUF2934 domain-containing protein [Candidatus Omnitrophota bacterium]
MGEHNCYQTDEAKCIQKKAHELWEKDGCKPGHDLDYWLSAEQNVKHGKKKEQAKSCA